MTLHRHIVMGTRIVVPMPMCEMNQYRWSDLYSDRPNDPTLVKAGSVN